MPAVRIARVEPELAEEAETIIQEYYEALSIIVRDTPEKHKTFWESEDSAMWVAWVQQDGQSHEKLAGCVILRPLSEISASAAECKRLYVKPTMRRMKIADKLCDEMETYAAARGFRDIYLDSHDGLQAAIGLYRRRGYVDIERYNTNQQATVFLKKTLAPSSSSSPSLFKQGRFCAQLCSRPTSKGQLQIYLDDSPVSDFFSLDQNIFLSLCLYLRKVAHQLATKLNVRRVGLASDHADVYLIPMHGLDEKWASQVSGSKPFKKVYENYLNTSSGPKQDSASLSATQSRLLSISDLSEPHDTTFNGDEEDDNLFAKLVRDEIEQFRFWEDRQHLAFLTPFPQYEGASCVIPRQHLSSDIFNLKEEDYIQLVKAAHSAATLLKQGLEVRQVAMFFEGYEIDYAHVKLYPIPNEFSNQATANGEEKFYFAYPGFLTTQRGPEATKVDLEDLYRLLEGINL